MIGPVRRFLQTLLACSVAWIAALAPFVPVVASAQEAPGLIRDAEIEALVRSYAQPIWRAAGLDADFVQVYLVNSPQINAFVTGGQRVFVNTGLLMRAENPNQVIGVLAHETGHIAGGHVARFDEAFENATVQSMIGLLLGTAGAVISRNGEVAAAGALAGQSMAIRSIYAFSIGQEERADQAGLGFLEKTCQSARGLLHFFEVLQREELLAPRDQDPFFQTHPLTQSRIDHIAEFVSHAKCSDSKDPPELLAAHARMVAKLRGFLEPIDRVMKDYPESDDSIPAHYARAAAYHRIPMDDKALSEMDWLLKAKPNDPYFLELRGQILFEGGHVPESVSWYRKAVAAKPSESLLRVELAQAELEANDDAATAREVEDSLKQAVRDDDSNADAWHNLALAAGRLGDVGYASLALAEEAILIGDVRLAGQQARRATGILPRGTPGWLRADDIANSVKQDRPETQ